LVWRTFLIWQDGGFQGFLLLPSGVVYREYGLFEIWGAKRTVVGVKEDTIDTTAPSPYYFGLFLDFPTFHFLCSSSKILNVVNSL